MDETINQGTLYLTAEQCATRYNISLRQLSRRRDIHIFMSRLRNIRTSVQTDRLIDCPLFLNDQTILYQLENNPMNRPPIHA